jgi:hypothetical protein
MTLAFSINRRSISNSAKQCLHTHRLTHDAALIEVIHRELQRFPVEN